MQIIQSASAKRQHPCTLQKVPCMEVKFDTGHSVTIYSDVRFYCNKNGRALSAKGVNLKAEMDRQIKEHFKM